MNLKDAIQAIKLAHLKNVPVLLRGQPGVGKTAISHQLALELGYNHVEVRPSQHLVEDITGLPIISADKKETQYTRPALLPKEKNTVFLIDEFMQAEPSLTKAYTSIIDSKQINGHALPENTLLLLAGNRQKDRASSFNLPSQLEDRLMILDIEFDLNTWVEWATNQNVDPCGIAFVKFKPTVLDSFNPADEKHCTPRSYTYACKFLDVQDRDLRAKMIKGLIGEAPQIELMAFQKIWHDLPTVEEILKQPEKIEFGKTPDVLFALTESLSTHTTIDNFATLLKFISRMPAEFQISYMTATVRRNTDIASTDEFLAFALKHKEVII